MRSTENSSFLLKNKNYSYIHKMNEKDNHNEYSRAIKCHSFTNSEVTQ